MECPNCSHCSIHNPVISNVLNIAARNNDSSIVSCLLKKAHPNIVDNRGWTCLHEAAYNDSYECLKLILQHSECRPLAETHEGQTALYLACLQRCSVQVIKALLDAADDIVNYCCHNGVTPLHIVSKQGRVDLIELFMQYGAMIDARDIEGRTPLIVADAENQFESVTALLCYGADTSMRISSQCVSVLHIACSRGSLKSVKILLPFVFDINQPTSKGNTPLMCALQGLHYDIVHFLLKNGADPNIKNFFGLQPLNAAIYLGCSEIISTLLEVTDDINPDIITFACIQHNFKFEILEHLLSNTNLGPEYMKTNPFNEYIDKINDHKPLYNISTPLNIFFNIAEFIYNKSPDQFKRIFYLFLMRGINVNGSDKRECPPLVYLQYSLHRECFKAAFQILLGQGCNVDYCSSVPCPDKDNCLPDAFHAAITKDPTTIPIMLPYSLRCEPEAILKLANKSARLSKLKMCTPVLKNLSKSIFGLDSNITPESLMYNVPPLKHFARLQVRSMLRNRIGGVHSTQEFIRVVDQLPLPKILKDYLQYQ